MTTLSGSSLWTPPSTRIGKWAAGLMAVFIVMWLINTFAFMPLGQPGAPDIWWREALLPFYGIFMMLCGFSAGVVGLIAVTWKHERSWMVWLTILPGAFVLFFILGEFLVPH